jgi:hypothetical protein
MISYLILLAALTLAALSLYRRFGTHTRPRKVTRSRKPAARTSGTRRNTGRPAGTRPRPLTLTPGLLPGNVRPSRNTRCTRCHGPILAGEDCIRTHNRRGLICPGCHIR